MAGDRGTLERIVDRVLSGTDIHVEVEGAFEGLDWELTGRRVDGVPHSVLQLVNHMAYWQEWVLKWLDGEEPPTPEHASGSWPGNESPRTMEEWEHAVGRFGKGLSELHRQTGQADLMSERGEKSRLEVLHAIASHNSYHLGQVVLLRQMLGSWPPPSGGLTW